MVIVAEIIAHQSSFDAIIAILRFRVGEINS